MFNVQSFFKNKRQLFLESVKYDLKPINASTEGESQIACTDTISTQMLDQRNIKLSFCRELNSVDNMVNIKVQFGIILELNDGVTLDEEKDLSNEFIGTSELSGLIMRASLLISQITASFGQPPLITSPTLIIKKEN